MTQISDGEVESLARRFCRVIGVDPDEVVLMSERSSKTRAEKNSGFDWMEDLPAWQRYRGIAFDQIAMDIAKQLP